MTITTLNLTLTDPHNAHEEMLPVVETCTTANNLQPIKLCLTK